MECAVDSDDILIRERGCTKVSTDLCKSGYIARSENIEFPEDALDVCCRCKEGEACPYCIDELSCTNGELAEFVTGNEQCFEPPPSEPEPPSEVEPPSDTKSNDDYMIMPILILVGLFIFILSRQ